MVSVAVVAILTAITVVAVRGATGMARDVGVLSDLRSTSQLFHAWSQDHRGQFLNMGVPLGRDPEPVMLERPDGSPVSVRYLEQWNKWHFVLEQWTGTYRPEGNGLISYGATFLTDPALWTNDPPPWSQHPARRHWREVFVAETAQPSHKGMLLRLLPEHTRALNPKVKVERYYMAYVDHSAGVSDEHNTPALTQGFMFGRPPGQAYPVHDTLDGALGRDVINR